MSAGTAYAKRYGAGFVDLPSTTTAIDSTFLNAVEAALLQLIGAAPTADGQVSQWDNANTRITPALLLNKNVDAAAAIAKSKIDLTGANGIVNADIAAAAAIALSKLAASGTIGTSPLTVGAAGKTALGIADSGAQLSGLTIGGDTNLYRSAASTIKTDGDLCIGTHIRFVTLNSGGAVSGTQKAIPVYNDAGVLQGYCPVYATYA